MATAGDRSSFEVIAREFLERRRRGEDISAEEYARRHPDFADEIRRLAGNLSRTEIPGRSSGESTDSLIFELMPDERPAPVRLGDYCLIRELGRGGMGIVYEAEQESLSRRVALKVLPAGALSDSTQIRRFEREARSAARLHHTNIVPVFGVGYNEGHHYYVMQLIQGRGLDVVVDELRRLKGAQSAPAAALRPAQPPTHAGRDVSAAQIARSLATERLAGADTPTGDIEAEAPVDLTMTSVGLADRPAATNPFSPPVGQSSQPEPASVPESELGLKQRVARIGVQAAEALEYAHRQGILHRDIKPANLLLDIRGNVWVTDFGLAKGVGGEDITNTGDVIGTLRYMAPERFQGEGDARSDTYALGLTLFELLSLRPAFDDQDRNRLILQVTQEDPPRLRKLDRSIPLDLETIVHKAMAREPGQRYATAGALAEDLARFVAGRPILARPISTSERMWRWCRRNPLVASLLAALMTVFLAGFLSVTALLLRTNELYEQSENRRVDSDRLRIVADRRRADAESLRLESERRRAEANQQRELTRRNLYYAQMHLAQQSWFGHVGIHRMGELLDRWLPGDGKPDLRGWEWYYLKGQPLNEMVTPPSGNLADKCVAWSPDGKRLAQTARDGITLQIRDAANLREILTLRGHASVVRNLAWSPDGKRLASGDVDGLLKVWNAQNGQPIAALPAHSARIQSVAWSPDGTRIATCGLDNLIKIWDLAATHHPVTLRGHSIRPNSVSWSPDGKRLVSGGQDNLLKVWDLATKSEVLSIKGHSNPVHAVAWSPDGSRLASGSADNTARIWDAATGRELLTLKAHTGWVNSVVWQGNGARLATCGSDSTVRLWDATTGLEEQTFHGHSTPVWSVTWSPDGSQVASIGSYGVIKVWDSNREPESLALRGHRQAVMSVAWSPDGSQLASGGEDGSVKLWNAATGREVLTLSGHENWVNSVAWSPGGRHVASGGSDGTVKIWDVATGHPVHNLGGDHVGVHAVAFSPDGKQLAACSRDGTIQLLEDLDDFRKVVTFSAHADAIHSLAWSPDSKLLASGCVDGTITIWNASGHQAIANLRAGGGWVSSLSWSPDGARLASACGHGINIWNVKEGRETLTLRGHTDAATGVSWSPDGLRVASTGSDRSVRIWDPNTGEETLLIPGHASTVFCDVAWSPDGLRLARAGLEDVRIWDATLGYERDHSPRALPYLDRKIAAGAATLEEIEFRAAILAEMGEWDRSGADWDRAVQLDPESQEPLLATGWWITGTDLPSTRQAEELAASPAPKPPVSDSNSPGPASVWTQAPVTSDGELAFDVPLPQENAPLGLLRVYSSVGQPVSATFLAADDLGAWLNGRQVHEPANTTNNKRSIRLPLILQKGWNSLAVHLARGEDPDRLSIRLSVAPADWSSTLLDSGRTEEAARLMAESVNRKPHDPRLLHAAARFHRRLGAQFRERNQPDAAQADERAACSLYAKLITQVPHDGALVSEFREYLRSLNARPSWTVLSPTTVTSEGGATLVRLADGSILAGGKNPEKDTYTFVTTTEINPITAIRLEVLADPTLPRAGPGRHAGGNFHLTAIALSAAPSHGSSSQAVIFTRAIASYTRPPDHDTTPRDGPRGAIDGTHETHWDIWPQVGKANAAYFAPKQPISGANSMTLTFRLHFRDPVYQQVNLGRLRLAVTSDPFPLAIEHWQAAGDRIGLAGAYFAAGDYRRAMELLEADIAANGGNVQSWLGLALCGAEIGRLPDARVWYDRALASLREHPTSDDGIREMVLWAMMRVAGLSRAEAEAKLRSF